MKKVLNRLLLPIYLALLSSAALAQVNYSISSWFEAHRDSPQMLRQFLQQMPKGADVHTHLSGAVYVETYLEIAKKTNACIDMETYRLYSSPCSGNGVLVKDLSRKERDQAIDHLSMRNQSPSGQSGHDRFFDSFGLLGAISGLYESQPIMLAEVANRAAIQNILLLELMVSIQSKQLQSLGERSEFNVNSDFAATRTWLLQHGLEDLVIAGQKDLDRVMASYKANMHCDTPDAHPGCAVKIRFLVQTSRNSTPSQVFAQLVYAFELAKADSRVVGINIVSPEDNAIALRDYKLQMEMVGYLSNISPQVKKALHAGELAFGSVPPENLRNHIFQAVRIAKADRIGHGVDIGYEEEAIDTLFLMRKKGIPVEICLTSNDLILNIKGRDSPLKFYMDAKVPVILSSDDEGVSRIDLTNEYLRAAIEQGLRYDQLKQISRNSLTWSFLPGESLWSDPMTSKKVVACRTDSPSAQTVSLNCEKFLTTSEKASTQWRLEREFQNFEKLPSWNIK